MVIQELEQKFKSKNLSYLSIHIDKLNLTEGKIAIAHPFIMVSNLEERKLNKAHKKQEARKT